MDRDALLPLVVRGRVLGRAVRDAVARRRMGPVLQAVGSFLAPGRWPPGATQRAAVLDRDVARGSARAARMVLGYLEDDPDGTRPGRPAALRRAAALTVLAAGAPEARRRIDLTVAAYLRGELGAAPRPPATDAATAASVAAALASGLRRDGVRRDGVRRDAGRLPVVVVTFPGFHANPYSRLMETAYAERGLAAVHVDDVAAVDAVVAGSGVGGYRVILHLNGPDRFVPVARTGAAVPAAAAEALGRIDGWIEAGATLITTVHNGPRLIGHRGAAERLVAQGIVDRARLVHLLTATTPAVLAGWITIDPARAVHVPHPNYDGAYRPLPPRAEARRRLGLDERLPSEGGEVVVGLLGYLADRKGGIDLLDAFTALPDPLPDGRRLRLVIGGMPSGRRSEELIRRAMGDARVVSRFGFIPDEALPELLATLDAAVVPYGAYLNSGWLHLALTYGIPVIAPDDRTTNEVARPGALRTFAAGDAGSLGAALAGAGDLATETARRDARASVEDLGSRRLSEAFVDAVLAATEDASPVPVPGPR